MRRPVRSVPIGAPRGQQDRCAGPGFYHRAVSLQPNEVLIIVFVALIVLGPTRLPGAIRSIGRAFRQVREFSTTVRQEMDATINPPIVEPPAQPSVQEPAAETAAGTGTGRNGDSAEPADPTAAPSTHAQEQTIAGTDADAPQRPTSDGSG